MRNAFGDRNPGSLQPRDLGGIVGEQPDAVLPEQPQHRRRDPEIARIDRKAEPEIGLDRVITLILQRIGPQLQRAIEEIEASGWGVLLYLRQEGRGIGLINKLRAYALQDQGFDTVDANLRLGFAIDERDFGVAARMLHLLGQDKVRLLTNNPAKVAGLEAAGIAVAERVAHKLGENPHNAAYLATKRDRTGHLL